MVIKDLQIPAAGLSPALLIEAPTVAEFAVRLHRIPGRATHQILTPLRRTGTRPPLFLIAGGGGVSVAFIPLIRKLGEDQPVYALHAHAMEHRGIPDWSVEAIAKRYLAQIHSVQPVGPYYLAGHSFGGVVAFEMARWLRGIGQEVGLLTILDSFPPDPRLLPPGPALSPLGRVRDAISLARTGLTAAPGDGQYWRFHRQSDFLSRRYSPSTPYPGRTLVVVADSAERDLRARWAPYVSGECQIVQVEGDHNSILREPHVAKTADLIGEALAQAYTERENANRAPSQR
jgi:thioesterase domain-containing protein